MRWRSIIGLTLALAVALVGWVYQRDIGTLRAALAQAARVGTGQGTVAYQAGGAGAPALALHGAGGGHDQGALLARTFLPAGYRWIAPSRFGYPGSDLPADPSTAAQADALAGLLDALGIDRVSVLAMSGGVPPAVQFARRHPDRTRALVLISSAPLAPLTAEAQDLPVPIGLYDALFATDFPLWAVVRLAPRALAPLFDARPEAVAAMTADEGAFLDAMIAAFLPVTPRRAGLANEGAAIHPAAALDLSALAVPTLIVHARDDRLAPVSTAAFLAGGIAGAEMRVFEDGGHLVLGHHEPARAAIAAFLARVAASEGADR